MCMAVNSLEKFPCLESEAPSFNSSKFLFEHGCYLEYWPTISPTTMTRADVLVGHKSGGYNYVWY